MNRGAEQNGGPLLRGVPLEDAPACAVMLHGRGASAESILVLADMLDVDNVCFLAPQAPGFSWYPYSFLEELDKNRGGIENGMRTIESLLEQIESIGPGMNRTALIGFSQGACLATEFIARHPVRYGALAGLAGGLIGPPGKEFSYSGSLEDTPVYLGCGDPDPHIPRERVEETAGVLESMGARVTVEFYPGIGHTVNDNEIEHVRNLLAGLSG